MRLYLVKRNDTINSNEYSGFVCAAENFSDAVSMNPMQSKNDKVWPVYDSFSNIDVSEIGLANFDIQSGIILTSF